MIIVGSFIMDGIVYGMRMNVSQFTVIYSWILEYIKAIRHANYLRFESVHKFNYNFVCLTRPLCFFAMEWLVVLEVMIGLMKTYWDDDNGSVRLPIL